MKRGEDEIIEKPADQRPNPRVIWNIVDRERGRIRVVACGDSLTPEKFLGTDAMGVEAWQFIQWDRWMQPIAEEYLKLIARGELRTDD